MQDMPVKDSKGRARFHGAFTGGFSAGYFNTVGSKEGEELCLRTAEKFFFQTKLSQF